MAIQLLFFSDKYKVYDDDFIAVLVIVKKKYSLVTHLNLLKIIIYYSTV